MAYYADAAMYFSELHLHGHKKKILFEGDSWFSIPSIANIPIQFDSKLDLSILCIADPGDTLEELSSGNQYKRLESLIKDQRFGLAWDALVFSAGSNDVIGPEVSKLLRKPADPSSKDHPHTLPDAENSVTKSRSLHRDSRDCRENLQLKFHVETSFIGAAHAMHHFRSI